MYTIYTSYMYTIYTSYIYVTGSRKRDHFADLLESRYRRLNSDNNNKTFFADLSFLLANTVFPRIGRARANFFKHKIQ